MNCYDCHNSCPYCQRCRLADTDKNPETCGEAIHWEDMEWDAFSMMESEPDPE